MSIGRRREVAGTALSLLGPTSGSAQEPSGLVGMVAAAGVLVNMCWEGSGGFLDILSEGQFIQQVKGPSGGLTPNLSVGRTGA